MKEELWTNSFRRPQRRKFTIPLIVFISAAFLHMLKVYVVYTYIF